MNKNILINGLTFLAGGVIGSLVTWKLVKTKYEQIANEEIDSMREYYNKKKEISENEKELIADELNEQKDSDDVKVKKISNMVRKLKYDMENKEEEDDMGGPVIIEPEELWERDYPTISLTYYEEDGVLADEKDKIISNVEELVGADFADHFGEYEDDSVYVRNDRLKVCYEILRDLGSYADQIGR